MYRHLFLALCLIWPHCIPATKLWANSISYNNGQATDLNSLLPSGSAWTLLAATGINDLGQIVGYGTCNGVNEGFLLTPSTLGDPAGIAYVPEPTSMVCFAAIFAIAVAQQAFAESRSSCRVGAQLALRSDGA